MPAPERAASHVAKAINDSIASPWAVWIAAASAALLFLFGDRIGIARPEVNLHLLVALVTFLMVFVIEHTQSREIAALHTKLDTLVAEHGDPTTVGVEERSQQEINAARDRRRSEDGPRRVRSAGD